MFTKHVKVKNISYIQTLTSSSVIKKVLKYIQYSNYLINNLTRLRKKKEFYIRKYITKRR